MPKGPYFRFGKKISRARAFSGIIARIARILNSKDPWLNEVLGSSASASTGLPRRRFLTLHYYSALEHRAT
jgi:hypothetical protein